MTTVSLQSLNACDRDDFVAALGDIYEHAPWVAQAAFAARPFATIAALHAAMQAAVRAAAGGAAARADQGPSRSRRQGRARRHDDRSIRWRSRRAPASIACRTTEFAQFHRLNDAYRAKFDIPFIVCVRRHGKDSILRQFEQRLRNNTAEEPETALAEIFRIVALRLDQRVEASDKLPVHGRLSTHVLDTRDGQPAAGVAIELLEFATSGDRGRTRAHHHQPDGRTDQPLIAGRPLPIGRYELRFAVGDYFARQGAAQADPPFLDVVPLRFAIAEPEGHYHVPLLVTPVELHHLSRQLTLSRSPARIWRRRRSWRRRLGNRQTQPNCLI